MLVPPINNFPMARPLEGLEEVPRPAPAYGGASPILVKAALLSACILGFLALVKLMEQFDDVLKPLVLAAMLAGCLEKAVEFCEFLTTRMFLLLWCMLQCRCNWRPLLKVRRWFRGNEPQLATTPGGHDVYITLDTLHEEENCIPEDALPAWTTDSAGSSFIARLFSILVVLTLVGIFLLQVSAALISSVHSTDLHVYQLGFQELEGAVLNMFKNSNQRVKESLSKQLDALEHNLSSVVMVALNSLLSGTTNFFVQLIMFMLYAFMWLLSPVKSGEQVFHIVRTYFMYKAFCNALFALCVWCLLTWIRCDLCIVITILCFFLGFIPEVGAFISLVIPLPLLLLDSRRTMETRLTDGLSVVIGMLLIKFVVSNGIESFVMSRSPVLAGQLDETSSAEETHPVIILFVVVLCGNIWGVVGMLISVPMLSLLRLILNLEYTKEAARNVQAQVSPRKPTYISEMASSARNSKTFSRESSVV